MNTISIVGHNAISARSGGRPKGIIKAMNHLFARILGKNVILEKK